MLFGESIQNDDIYISNCFIVATMVCIHKTHTHTYSDTTYYFPVHKQSQRRSPMSGCGQMSRSPMSGCGQLSRSPMSP